MRTAILGAGSLGTVLGAFIAKAGRQVDLVSRNAAHLNAMKERGAVIKGTVDLVVPVNTVLTSEMEGKYDLVFYMAKQTANEVALKQLLPHLSDDGIVVTMQNGLPEPEVEEYIGKGRVAGCPVGWAAVMTEPGVSTLTSNLDQMSFDIGWPDGHVDKKLEEIKEILECLCTTNIITDLMEVRWAKLLTNATFSGMSAALGATFGETVSTEENLYVTQHVANECIKVCHASGFQIGKIQGSSMEAMYGFKDEADRERVRPMYEAMKPVPIVASMLTDLRNGKKTEINAINGVVCKYGRQNNVATPFNDKVVEIVTGCEEGKYKPCAENIKLFGDLSKL